jgi:hypothetical protein
MVQATIRKMTYAKCYDNVYNLYKTRGKECDFVRICLDKCSTIRDKIHVSRHLTRLIGTQSIAKYHNIGVASRRELQRLFRVSEIRRRLAARRIQNAALDFLYRPGGVYSKCRMSMVW